MVITCEECETRFQLDDSRIPDTGVRVRCSRCKHAFFVKPSALTGDEPIERGVAQALAQDAEDLPVEVGPDTDDETIDRAGQSDAVADIPAARAATPADAPNDLDEFESAIAVEDHESPSESANRETPSDSDTREPDWEFNHEPQPSHDAALAEAREVVDDLLDVGQTDDAEHEAKESFFGGGDDAEDDIDALLGTARAEAEAASEPTEPIPFEAIAAEPAEEAPPIQTAAAAEPDRVEDDATHEREAEPSAVDAGEVPGDSVDPLEGLADDELGSPDEWDFFDAPAGAAGVAGEHAQSAGVPVGRVGLTSASALDASRTVAHEDLAPLGREPSRLGIWAARSAEAFGWVATLSLTAAVLVTGLEPQAAPLAVGVANGAGLELVGVNARGIDNAAGGSITVIEGSFRAPNGAARGPGARFVVQLLNAEGEVLLADAATLGPALAPSALRETEPAQLRETLGRAGQAAAWRPVTRGAAWPFHAVVQDVPADAMRFDIVAVPVDAPRPPAASSVLPLATSNEATASSAPTSAMDSKLPAVPGVATPVAGEGAAPR